MEKLHRYHSAECRVDAACIPFTKTLAKLSSNMDTYCGTIATVRRHSFTRAHLRNHQVASQSEASLTSPLVQGDLVPYARRRHQTQRSSASQRRGTQLRCAMCRTEHTPQWRQGPLGDRTLCNVCGLVYKKQQKRAALSLSNWDAASRLPSAVCAAK